MYSVSADAIKRQTGTEYLAGIKNCFHETCLYVNINVMNILKHICKKDN